MDVIFDMETGDPDDFFTLCLLAGHSKCNLRAVTVTPGSKEQIGVIRKALDLIGHSHIRVGSYRVDHPKSCVSSFHYKIFDKIIPEYPDGQGYEIIEHTLIRYPDATIITGAPVCNIKKFIQKHPNVPIKRWVGQGGFAGDNVVPPEYRLKKFEGMETCPTYNFNGDIEGAKLLLASEQIAQKLLVSKNVCHGVIYDQKLHEEMYKVQNKSPGFKLLYKGMTVYLQKRKSGKIFHDPLAACVALVPSICEFKEVEIFHCKKGWGAKRKKGTNTFISIQAFYNEFVKVLTDTYSGETGLLHGFSPSD